MGKYIITKRTNGDYQFNLNANNGETILTSQGYGTKAACENGIESVIRNSPDDSNFEHLTSSNGKAYFNLKASNGQIIGTSEMYEREANRSVGIQSVKNNAPNSAVEDLTSK